MLCFALITEQNSPKNVSSRRYSGDDGEKIQRASFVLRCGMLSHEFKHCNLAAKLELKTMEKALQPHRDNSGASKVVMMEPALPCSSVRCDSDGRATRTKQACRSAPQCMDSALEFESTRFPVGLAYFDTKRSAAVISCVFDLCLSVDLWPCPRAATSTHIHVSQGSTLSLSGQHRTMELSLCLLQSDSPIRFKWDRTPCSPDTGTSSYEFCLASCLGFPNALSQTFSSFLSSSSYTLVPSSNLICPFLLSPSPYIGSHQLRSNPRHSF